MSKLFLFFAILCTFACSMLEVIQTKSINNEELNTPNAKNSKPVYLSFIETPTKPTIPSPNRYSDAERIQNLRTIPLHVLFPQDQIVQPLPDSPQKFLISDIQKSNTSNMIQENVEKRDVQIPPKSPKLWTDEYDDIIQSFVEMSKYAAIFDPYTFNAIELPLLKNYLNPQAPTLERQKQIMHGTNGAIMTLKNYPNQYVEKILANKVPQNFVNSETKIGIYASYLNPNLFVSHLGQIGPGEEGRSLLLEKCQSDLKQYMNDNGVDKQSRQKVYRSMLINLMNFLPQVLNELKNLGIVHFDIKNENILICNGSLKLGDFGAAKLLSEKLNMRGTIGFESPLQKRGIFDPNADKYAAGKTILEFLYYVSSSKYAQSDPYHENHFKDPLSLPFEERIRRIDHILKNIDPYIVGMEEYDFKDRLKDLLHDYLIYWQRV